jgi:DNA polymerase-1
VNASLRLVETLEDAMEFRTWLGERRPIMGVDTETTGLHWWTPNFLRTVQFGDGATGWTIPWTWWGKLIKDSLAAYEDPIVFHNAKFDLHALSNAGVSLRPGTRIHDTKMMSWLLEPPTRHGLKPLSMKHIDKDAGIFEAQMKAGFAKNGWDWATVPLEWTPYWAYAATDPVFTCLLAEKFWPQVNAQGYRAAYDTEMQVQNIAFRLEERGMRLDVDYTERKLSKMLDRLSVIGNELHTAGVERPGSNVLIQAALQAEGWDPDDWTPSGQAKLTADILKGIDSDIAPLVLEYRKLKKLTGSYLSNFLDKRSGDVLHATMNTLAARTGRMSVSEPALQTLPRGPEIRRCFIPREGGKIISVDFDQIEARLFAAFAAEPAMLQAILDGVDLHSLVAEAVGIPRQAAKAVNFGKLYGAGAAKIADTAGVTVEAAEEFLHMYEERFPGTVVFMDSTGHSRIFDRPGVRLRDGRVLPGDDGKEYALTNYMIQGTAALVLKEKMIALDNAGLAEYMVMPVHDEFIFDCPAAEADELLAAVTEACVDDSFGVHLTAGGDIWSNWGAKYEK